MGNLIDDLSQKILSNPVITSGAWVDSVVSNIQASAVRIKQPEFKNAVIAATQTLLKHKDDIAAIGVYGLTVFLQKLATGDNEGAYLNFIQTQATFQDLIDGENADANAIIEEKLKRDEMKSNLKALFDELALDGVRALLPFLIGLV